MQPPTPAWDHSVCSLHGYDLTHGRVASLLAPAPGRPFSPPTFAGRQALRPVASDQRGGPFSLRRDIPSAPPRSSDLKRTLFGRVLMRPQGPRKLTPRLA